MRARGSQAPSSKFQALLTEAVHPGTAVVDRMAVPDIIDLFAAEDRKVVAAVTKERDRIARGVDLLTAALRTGGRIVLVGAGTSGRLGVLEAAELPPTFGSSRRQVRAIIAGGPDAVYRAREGAEDNARAGARIIARLRPSKRDVVIGISASGVTPFVRGAMTAARTKGARVILITCAPGIDLSPSVDVVIAPAVGAEIVAGSTRLKAGTATKLVLNMLTTIAMIRIGKTYGNLMVDVRPGSEKLRDRGRRIVSLVAGVGLDEANALLGRARWNVKAAIVMGKTGVSSAQALRRLRRAGNSVRDALGERS